MKIIFIFIFPFFTYAHAEVIKGIAKNLKNMKVSYIELHTVSNDENGFNKIIETQYLSSLGKEIAVMKSDFSKNKQIPEIDFTDYRFDSKISQRFDSESNKVTISKYKSQKLVSTRQFNIDEKYISGPGFNNFIKMNFLNSSLDSIQFNFIVLEKLDYFSFQAFYNKDLLDNKISVLLKPTSFFLKIFLSPIEIQYELNSSKLSSYKGISNILTDDEQSQSVQITYEVVKN